MAIDPLRIGVPVVAFQFMYTYVLLLGTASPYWSKATISPTPARQAAKPSGQDT